MLQSDQHLLPSFLFFADVDQFTHVLQHTFEISLGGAHLTFDQLGLGHRRFLILFIRQFLSLCQIVVSLLELSHPQRVKGCKLVEG